MLIARDSRTRGARGGAGALNVGTLRARARRQSAVIAGVVVAVTVLSAWLLQQSVNAVAIAGALAVPIVLVWVWRRPVRGVYVLLAAAVMQETAFGQPYPDDLGRYLPFFQDISTWTHVKGLPYSVSELFMAFVLLAWLLKDVAARRLRFDRGSLMLPLGLYMVMILVGEVNGLLTGGDYTLSLWEVRVQAAIFVLYVLTCNLVKTRRQVDTLVWIILLGAGVKGVQGVFRYVVTLHGSLGGSRQLFEHSQSYFFNAAITLAFVLFLYAGSRRMKLVALSLLPIMVAADLANQRRAAVLALGVGLVAMCLVTLVAHPARRRVVVIVLLAVAVLWPLYYATFQNTPGLVGEPARAVASNSAPTASDASSNLYRDYEDKDILYTMRTSPIIGYGFGKPFLTPYGLIDVGYVFARIAPHNSILWVWMRLGSIGYLLFWLLIGTSIVQAVRLTGRLRDPYLKGLAVLIASLVMQEVIVGYLDIQWTGVRNLITVGVLFALLSRLAIVARMDEGELAVRGDAGGRSRSRSQPRLVPAAAAGAPALVGARHGVAHGGDDNWRNAARPGAPPPSHGLV